MESIQPIREKQTCPWQRCCVIPQFSDEECITVYLWGISQRRFEQKTIYNYTKNHLHEIAEPASSSRPPTTLLWHVGSLVQKHASRKSLSRPSRYSRSRSFRASMSLAIWPTNLGSDIDCFGTGKGGACHGAMPSCPFGQASRWRGPPGRTALSAMPGAALSMSSPLEAAGTNYQSIWKCRRAASMAVSISDGTCGGSVPSSSGRLWPPWVMMPCFRLTWVTYREETFKPYSCNTHALISL